jgi:methyladenine glycosylase
MQRCAWARNDLAIRYHDDEWGTPVHDDRRLFEFLILEGAQAGLSWDTILAKRENYRAAFDRFDPIKVSRYTPALIQIGGHVSGISRIHFNRSVSQFRGELNGQRVNRRFRRVVRNKVNVEERRIRIAGLSK